MPDRPVPLTDAEKLAEFRRITCVELAESAVQWVPPSIRAECLAHLRKLKREAKE